MTNENGQNLYLVIGDAEGEEFTRIMTAKQIFDMMDMDDCYNVKIDIYAIDAYGFAPRECYFYGTWTYPGDPLRMRIMCNGEAIETGWGTDH